MMVGPKPTTVAKLEAKLCENGIDFDGVLPLEPDAAREGREWYPEVMTLMFGPDHISIDFSERYSADKVEMRTHVPAEMLPRVAEAIASTHGDKRERIGVSGIVTVTTAIAVAKALKGGK